jgi:hypothetical protein
MPVRLSVLLTLTNDLTGGRYLNSPEHRNGLESMLLDFGRNIGWPVECIIEKLEGVVGLY